MNEKIQKLAEEAGLDVRTMGFENNQYQHDPWNARLSKFTQLIVKECINICRECIKDGYDEAEEPRGRIKQHFGVEE